MTLALSLSFFWSSFFFLSPLSHTLTRAHSLGLVFFAVSGCPRTRMLRVGRTPNLAGAVFRMAHSLFFSDPPLPRLPCLSLSFPHPQRPSIAQTPSPSETLLPREPRGDAVAAACVVQEAHPHNGEERGHLLLVKRPGRKAVRDPPRKVLCVCVLVCVC